MTSWFDIWGAPAQEKETEELIFSFSSSPLSLYIDNNNLNFTQWYFDSQCDTYVDDL